MSDYRTVNRAHWDERAAAHAGSSDYAFARLQADPASISDIVRFDLPRLGDVAGLVAVHLQCHIGTDTISLARLGARMTGLDFSGASIAEAQRLADRTGTDITFVQSDVYEADRRLPRETFDLVYTGVGALCWLPDIRRWARTVAALLRSGGRVFLREAHPMLWALDDERTDGLLVVDHPYFERPEATVFHDAGTYVRTDQTFETTETHTWNHALGETVTALLDAGLRITQLAEHDTVPWEALPGQMERVDAKEWRLRERPWRLAHSYTLQAVKDPPA